jgi:hypothetical protein
LGYGFAGVLEKEFDNAMLPLFVRPDLGLVFCMLSDLAEKELSKAPDRCSKSFKESTQ